MHLKSTAVLISILRFWMCEGKWPLERIVEHYSDAPGHYLHLNPYFELKLPVNVSVNIYIMNLHALREDTMEFEFDCYLRMKWNDPRLVLPEEAGWDADADWITFDPYLAWIPDLFLPEARNTQMHFTLHENALLKWKPNGDMFCSFKLSITLKCNMDLSAFPFDQQECSFSFESFGDSTESMSLSWMSHGVGINPNGKMMAFKLIDSKVVKNSNTYTAGTYEQLQATLKFKRLSSHYVVFVYLPSSMLVCLGALLFWLPVGAMGERTTYSGFLFLAMVVLTASSQYAAPQVGYLKAIDVWCAACTFYLFAAISEVMILHLLRERQEQRTVGTFHEMKEESSDETSTSAASEDIMALTGKLAVFRNPRVVYWIDLVLKIAYPATFLLFVIIYACVFHG